MALGQRSNSLQEQELSLDLDQQHLVSGSPGGMVMVPQQSSLQQGHAYKKMVVDAYKKMVVSVASKMEAGNVNTAAYLSGLPDDMKPLDALKQLERKGVFGQDSVEGLAQLLKDIDRCDLVPTVTEYTEYQSRLRHELEQHHHHQQASQAAFTKPVNPSHSLLPLNATPPSQETLQQLHQEPFPDYSPEDTSPLFVEAGVANHDSSLFYNPSSHNPAPSNGQSYHLTPRRLPSDGAIVLRQQSLSSQSSHSLHSASSFPDHSGYQHYPPQQQHLNNAAFGVYSTSASASASGSDVSIASCGPRYGRYQEVLEASAPPAAAYVYDGTNLVTRRGRRRLVNPVSGTQTPPPNLVPHSRSLSYQHAVIRPVRSYEWIPFTTTKPQHTPLAPPPHHAHTAPIVVGGKTTPNHPRTTPTQAPATPTSNQRTTLPLRSLSQPQGCSISTQSDVSPPGNNDASANSHTASPGKSPARKGSDNGSAGSARSTGACASNSTTSRVQPNTRANFAPLQSWKVKKKELVKDVHSGRMTISEKPVRLKKHMEVILPDLKPGHYPKLRLELIPSGYGADEGKSMTLNVRVDIPAKCSHSVTEKEVPLRVRAVRVEDKARKLVLLGFKEQMISLGSSITYLYDFVSHASINRLSGSDSILIEATTQPVKIRSITTQVVPTQVVTKDFEDYLKIDIK